MPYLFQHNRADKSIDVNRLDLKLFEFDESNKEGIVDSPLIREVFKGKFPYTNAIAPIVSATFFPLIRDGELQQNIWINYTVLHLK
jgi:hypothetical protein